MLPDELWANLELERGRMEQRAWFFEAFARTMDSPAQPQIGELIERSRSALDPQRGLAVFGNPPGIEEGDTAEADFEEEWEGSEPVATERPGWVHTAAQGDAYRQAAAAMLLVDTKRGRGLLSAAGRHYAPAARPYGFYLMGLTESRAGSSAQMAREMLVASVLADRQLHMVDGPLIDAEQVYLMLAAASSPLPAESTIARHRDEELPIDLLLGRLREMPGARSPAPFGTSNEATAEWWRLASDLFELGLRPPSQERVPRERLRERLGHLALPQGESLERAKLDTYHWRSLHTQVELIDLDVAGAVCVANRTLGAFGEPLTSEDFGEIPPLARLSLQVGIELSGPEENGPPPTGSRHPVNAA